MVGPYEENGYAENPEDLASSLVDPRELQSSRSAQEIRTSTPGRKPRSLLHVMPTGFYRIIKKIQDLGRHTVCPHPFSCTYYTLQVCSDVIKVQPPLHMSRVQCDVYTSDHLLRPQMLFRLLSNGRGGNGTIKFWKPSQDCIFITPDLKKNLLPEFKLLLCVT